MEKVLQKIMEDSLDKSNGMIDVLTANSPTGWESIPFLSFLKLQVSSCNNDTVEMLVKKLNFDEESGVIYVQNEKIARIKTSN